MELLMPAGRSGITLRTTLIHVASRYAAVTYGTLASDHTVLACASLARISGRRHRCAVVDFTIFVPATEFAFFSGRFQILRRRAHALVAALLIDAFRGRMTRVPPFDRQIVALVYVDAVRALGAVMQGVPVTRLASAVVPAGHIETRGRMMTSM